MKDKINEYHRVKTFRISFVENTKRDATFPDGPPDKFFLFNSSSRLQQRNWKSSGTLLNGMRVRASAHVQAEPKHLRAPVVLVFFGERCTVGIVYPHLRVFQPIHRVEWESAQAARPTKRTRKETKVTKRRSFSALPRADKRSATLSLLTAISSGQAQQGIAILFTVFISGWVFRFPRF